MKKIDIVLPCYNPPLNWVENIEANSRAICSHFANYSINFFVINDGSPNIDPQEIEQLRQLEFINWHQYKENRGKGFACVRVLQWLLLTLLYILTLTSHTN